MSASLVGSEMCIRDSWRRLGTLVYRLRPPAGLGAEHAKPRSIPQGDPWSCLLYTSDAADDM
eukprot:5531637-Alexandrium_andersonii.AAC.1